MPAADLAAAAASPAPAAAPARAAYRQFPVAWRFALRNQTRNRLASCCWSVFVPVWYLLLEAMTGHKPLTFKLFATGQLVSVDGGHLT